MVRAVYLAVIALRVGRAKDFTRILQFVEAGVLDSEKLNAILKRHHLLARWEDFDHKFLEDTK